MKQIIITVIVVVGIIGGAVLLGKKDNGPIAATGSNNIFGAETPVVTLTEYGDFQCPACASYFPVVKQLKEEFKDQLRFEFKHFPLVQIHPNATAAHRAAEAAAKQGKFWEMHDLLYERQSAWSGSTNPSSIFEGYAEELNLDMDRYTNEVNSSEVLAIINADIEAGKSLGADSTPTFLMDGQRVDNTSVVSPESFRKLIQDAINSKSAGNEQTDKTSDDASTEPSEATDDATVNETTSSE